MQQITASQLAQWLSDASHPENEKMPVLLDVREPWEYETCHIQSSSLMTMHTVPMRFQELDEDAEIICICHHGGRSMQVANFLERQGFTQVFNLSGGVHAWAQQVDASMPTY